MGRFPIVYFLYHMNYPKECTIKAIFLQTRTVFARGMLRNEGQS